MLLIFLLTTLQFVPAAEAETDTESKSATKLEYPRSFTSMYLINSYYSSTWKSVPIPWSMKKGSVGNIYNSFPLCISSEIFLTDFKCLSGLNANYVIVLPSPLHGWTSQLMMLISPAATSRIGLTCL